MIRMGSLCFISKEPEGLILQVSYGRLTVSISILFYCFSLSYTFYASYLSPTSLSPLPFFIGHQVAEVTASLNSEDVFVLITPLTTFIWQGVACTSDELEVGTNIGNILTQSYNNTSGRQIIEVLEGEESDYFWSFLGGKGDYAKTSSGGPLPYEARLFHASTATGSFRVIEVENFDQEDLIEEDTFVMDTYTQVFLWIGEKSTTEEKTKSIAFAMRFASEAADGRDPSIPVIKVTSGSEPLMFTSHFTTWDPTLAERSQFKDIYQIKREKQQAQKIKDREENVAKPMAVLNHVAVETKAVPSPTRSPTKPFLAKNVELRPPAKFSPREELTQDFVQKLVRVRVSVEFRIRLRIIIIITITITVTLNTIITTTIIIITNTLTKPNLNRGIYDP
jgi:hypothetical protein